MKRAYLLLLGSLMCLSQAMAIPAKPGTATVTQPDGTRLTIRLVGDEYLHYNTTDDGYSVVRNQKGFYVYAQRSNDGRLVPTEQIAHDAAERQTAELAFLAGWQKQLQPQMDEQQSAEKERERARRRDALERRRVANYDYSKFRGLVILVEFNDRSFDMENYKDIITAQITQEDYSGYTDYNNRRVSCTGSVYDYFRDNSLGVFTPDFDVVGPVQVDRSQQYPKGTDMQRLITLTNDVLDAVDDQVDFRQYDTDGDGSVDMVYFIFAGHGSHVTGNNADFVWPHASYIYGYNNGQYSYVWKDGVRMGRYACSTEMASAESYRTIDGIGTICHEFSHVLGLPDFYDTDYQQNGQSNDPGSWSLMAGGSYLNSSRTPAGYSLLEREMVGFAEPVTISKTGSYSLENLSESNTGFRINSPVRKEYFILENRQQQRWDTYLPGHGLLVFRVDSTSTQVWSNNTVNANANHNYYELVRARGRGASGSYDPFPGRGNVTVLNNTTTPANLRTWSGKETQFGLLNISETDGTIRFDIEDTYVLRELSLPETFQLGLGLNAKIPVTAVPEYANYKLTWVSADENIVMIDQDGTVYGINEGTTTVTASSDNGLQATCTVIVASLPEAEQIAEFKTFKENTDAVLRLKDAQVLYVYNDDIYLRDGSGAIIFRETGLDVKQNDVVNGTFMGRLTRTNKMPQFRISESLPADLSITTGQTVQPRHVKVGDLTEADYADYIIVDTVALVRDGNVFAVDDNGNRIARLYSVFGIRGIKVPSDIEGKRFNLQAIYGTHLVGYDVINEFYMLRSPNEVEWKEDTGIEAILGPHDALQGAGTDATVFDLQGRRVATSDGANAANGNLPKGVYIVGGRKYVRR